MEICAKAILIYKLADFSEVPLDPVDAES